MSNFKYCLKKISFTSNKEFNWGWCPSWLQSIMALLDYAITQLFHTLCKYIQQWLMNDFSPFLPQPYLRIYRKCEGNWPTGFCLKSSPRVSTYSFKKKNSTHRSWVTVVSCLLPICNSKIQDSWERFWKIIKTTPRYPLVLSLDIISSCEWSDNRYNSTNKLKILRINLK